MAMFQKRHYQYLAHKIIEDPKLDVSMKMLIHVKMSQWFEKDFTNFNTDVWRKSWTDHFH